MATSKAPRGYFSLTQAWTGGPSQLPEIQVRLRERAHPPLPIVRERGSQYLWQCFPETSLVPNFLAPSGSALWLLSMGAGWSHSPRPSAVLFPGRVSVSDFGMQKSWLLLLEAFSQSRHPESHFNTLWLMFIVFLFIDFRYSVDSYCGRWRYGPVTSPGPPLLFPPSSQNRYIILFWLN